LAGGPSESVNIEHLTGDILNPTDLDHALRDCTVVFHLAALVHVGHSQTAPVHYFEVNGLGTAHVVEACRRVSVRRVIYTSTSHVYGVPRRLPVTEDHPTVPVSAYAASKLAGEVVLQGYAASYGISCGIARLSNLYGAAFSAETVIGRALRQVVSGQPIALHNLASVRDFIHADDVVEALVRLAAVGDDLTGCRIVNVSTGRGVSVREMAQTLASIAAEQGLGLPEVIQTGSDQSEIVPSLVLDNSRLRELTHWTPQINLEQGLRLALQELEQKRETEQ
jgi:nucleoside-diphosphate-sugar epimerase